MIRLIAFDMDGTLLTDDKEISEKTLEALGRARDMGIHLVPTTGRPMDGAEPYLDQIPGVRYVITCNGAGIYDWEKGTCIHRDAMELDYYLPMLRELNKLHLMADSFVDGGALMNRDRAYMIDGIATNEATKDYIRTSRKLVDDQEEYLRKTGKPVEKLTVNFVVDESGHRVDFQAARDLLEKYPQVNPVSGGMHNIEVTKKDVTKATGLAWLGKKLGIGPEEMMAFGDSGNDAAMLSYVGLGIAMGNSEDLAIEAAKETTASNMEDGIAVSLTKYLWPQSSEA
ncbi:MAG: Cof-type HAD-IIB family hydrolase [Eubacterium sp.]|nr:Cof-type HAD-IIB family hydrolase [Eubacterium sp.]